MNNLKDQLEALAKRKRIGRYAGLRLGSIMNEKAKGKRRLRKWGYLVGKTFNRLTVTGIDTKSPISKLYCKCSCGKKTNPVVGDVIHGRSKSCGCFQVDRTIEFCKSKTIHGMSRSKEWAIWCGMIARCNNTKNISYKNYGGRGIKVCKRWRKFTNFFEDMGRCPPKHSIDRIDNNKGYSLKNCRWATQKQQTNNTRRTIFITVEKTRLPFTEWCELLDISYSKARKKYYKHGADGLAEYFKIKLKDQKLQNILKGGV